MAIAVNTGVVDTEARLADEKPVDMADKIAMLDPETSQFMTMLSRLPSTVATQIKPSWLEDQLFPNASTLSATGASGATSATVATGEGVYFRVNDVVLHGPSGEKLLVTAISGDVLTVTRGIGGVAAAALATGDEVVIIGNAAEQGADTGTLKSTDRVLGYNYTQIQRTPGGFTGTDTQIALYGADDPAREIAKKGVEHKRRLEWSLWTGGRDLIAAGANGKPQGFAGGITEYLSTNVETSVGALSATGFDALMQPIFQHGNMSKVIFAAPGPAAALSHIQQDAYLRVDRDENVLGVKVAFYVSGAYGQKVPVIVKREWGAFASSGRSLGGAIFVLDLEFIQRRPMRNRDTRLLQDRQGNGEDSVVFDYLTESSLQVANEAAHGVFFGVTG